MTRPAIYVRVSTQTQASEGLSLEEQRRRTEAYCRAMEWPAPVLYIDAGVSAFSDDAAARPGFARLLADCEAGLIDQIVVAKMSRWARSTTVTVQTLKRFEQIGVSLYSLDDKVDFATPIGRMVTTILASINEYESDEKAETARRIHAYLKSQGKWDGGRPPFGARLDAEGRLEVDPDKAALLARLLTLAATESPHTIARLFAEEGVPPPGTGYRWSALRPAWSPQSLGRMIRGADWLRHQPAPWPALVGAAQRRPVAPRVAPARPTRMLTGLMRCTSGGAVSYGSAGPYNRGGLTVRCRDYGGRPGGARCPHGHTYAAVYEAAVLAAVGALAARLAALDPLEEAREGEQAAAWAALDGERERVRHMYRVGALTPAAFEAEWSSLEDSARALGRQVAGPLAVLVDLLPALRGFAGLEPADQNRLLRRFLVRVEVAGKSAEVVWRPGIAEIMA